MSKPFKEILPNPCYARKNMVTQIYATDFKLVREWARQEIEVKKKRGKKSKVSFRDGEKKSKAFLLSF